MERATRAQRLFAQNRIAAAERARYVHGAPFTAADVEALIAIARQAAPSAAFRRAVLYLHTARPDLAGDEMLASRVSRATRWLAVIRRDEGDAVFDRMAQAWRDNVP